MDLIDLISERHMMLRKMIDNKWNETSELYISNSEWFIMARIYRKQPTVSQVTKQVDITRQAVHKFIKSLQAKGLVETTKSTNNKDKCLRLTPLGEECYEKNTALKEKLEQTIAETIGEEDAASLKRILKLNWGI